MTEHLAVFGGIGISVEGTRNDSRDRP